MPSCGLLPLAAMPRPTWEARATADASNAMVAAAFHAAARDFSFACYYYARAHNDDSALTIEETISATILLSGIYRCWSFSDFAIVLLSYTRAILERSLASYTARSLR